MRSSWHWDVEEHYTRTTAVHGLRWRFAPPTGRPCCPPCPMCGQAEPAHAFGRLSTSRCMCSGLSELVRVAFPCSQPAVCSSRPNLAASTCTLLLSAALGCPLFLDPLRSKRPKASTSFFPVSESCAQANVGQPGRLLVDGRCFSKWWLQGTLSSKLVSSAHGRSHPSSLRITWTCFRRQHSSQKSPNVGLAWTEQSAAPGCYEAMLHSQQPEVQLPPFFCLTQLVSAVTYSHWPRSLISLGVTADERRPDPQPGGLGRAESVRNWLCKDIHKLEDH